MSPKWKDLTVYCTKERKYFQFFRIYGGIMRKKLLFLQEACNYAEANFTPQAIYSISNNVTLSYYTQLVNLK